MERIAPAKAGGDFFNILGSIDILYLIDILHLIKYNSFHQL